VLKDEVVEEIKRLHKAGLSTRAIAEKVRVSHMTVARILRGVTNDVTDGVTNDVTDENVTANVTLPSGEKTLPRRETNKRCFARFKQGAGPLDIVIEFGLAPEDAERLHRDFVRLHEQPPYDPVFDPEIKKILLLKSLLEVQQNESLGSLLRLKLMEGGN